MMAMALMAKYWALQSKIADRYTCAYLHACRYWASDLQSKIADHGVQLHGGWGYMWEYPVCRAYVDARVQSIYGGSNEIMKEL